MSKYKKLSKNPDQKLTLDRAEGGKLKTTTENKPTETKLALAVELEHRLSRIEGQVKGIEKMVAEGKDCLSIVTQIMAARSALASVATKILTQESCKLDPTKKRKDFEKVITSLLDFHK